MIEESFVLFLTVFFHCFAEVSDSIKTPITARASASPLPTAVAIFGNLESSFDIFTVFPVISAPGAFENEMKHCHFQPAISAPSYTHV